MIVGSTNKVSSENTSTCTVTPVMTSTLRNFPSQSWWCLCSSSLALGAVLLVRLFPRLFVAWYGRTSLWTLRSNQFMHCLLVHPLLALHSSCMKVVVVSPSGDNGSTRRATIPSIRNRFVLQIATSELHITQELNVSSLQPEEGVVSCGALERGYAAAS